MPVGTKLVGAPSIMLVRNVYSGTNVTTSAYVTLTLGGTNVVGTSITYTTVPAPISRLQVFDSSGSALVLAVATAPGSETDIFYINPGGLPETVDIFIPKGMILRIKAVDVNATQGQLLITALGGPS